MLRSVLVPTDFSSNAKVALRYAQSLARRYGAKLLIGHAYGAVYSAFQTEEVNEAHRQHAEDEARQAMEKFLRDIPGLDTVEVSYLAKNLEDAVLEWVDEYGSELVVMGTKGASNAPQQLLGSHTLGVVSSVPVPVIVVPEKTESFRLNQIAFFTDHHPNDMVTARALQQLLEAEGNYRFIHIHDDSKDFSQAEKRLSDWVDQLRGALGSERVTWELAQGPESVELVDRISADAEVDLLVLTLTEKGFFEKLFGKSLAKAIIHQPSTPVFLVNEEVDAPS